MKAAGAIKVVFLARAFGASDELDAYLVALLLPSFVSEIVAGSFVGALVPGLIDIRERRGMAAAERVRASLLAVGVLALALLAVLLWMGSPVILRLLASDFGSVKLALTHRIFVWLLPILPMSGLSIVWRATLNCEERFLTAAAAPAMTPLLTITALWLAAQSTLPLSIWILPAAHLAGLTLELVWLAAAMHRRSLGILPGWTGWDPEMRTVLMQHLPLVAVAAAANAGMLIDQSMAASLGSGSVASFNYGTRLSAVAGGVAGGALSTAALPRFSRMTAAQDRTGLRAALTGYGKLIALVVVPCALLLIGVSDRLVRLVFQHGVLTGRSVDLIASVQRWSLLQLPLVVFAAILVRLLSSFQSNELLIRVALTGLALNVALDVALKQFMGLPGIALAGSLVQLATCGYLLVLVNRAIPPVRP